jgi:hypothetical protein
MLLACAAWMSEDVHGGAMAASVRMHGAIRQVIMKGYKCPFACYGVVSSITVWSVVCNTHMDAVSRLVHICLQGCCAI